MPLIFQEGLCHQSVRALKTNAQDQVVLSVSMLFKTFIPVFCINLEYQLIAIDNCLLAVVWYRFCILHIDCRRYADSITAAPHLHMLNLSGNG